MDSGYRISRTLDVRLASTSSTRKQLATQAEGKNSESLACTDFMADLPLASLNMRMPATCAPL